MNKQIIFLELFNDELTELLVEQSNRYAARKNRLRNITREEIKCCIGILRLSGYVKYRERSSIGKK